MADVIELLLCTDGVVLSFGGTAEAQFEVASAATKNGFEVFEGVTGPDTDEVWEIAGDIADRIP